MINLSHACIHPRKIVPNSLPSYKTLFSKHKCSTYSVQTVSTLVSFKFSLMLVSHFWMHPRYSGDYSALNWMQFNKFAFTFLVLPYPIMMYACGSFILTHGFFSYPGFVAFECIVLSTCLSGIMFHGACSIVKCHVPHPSARKPHKVATGAAHEDDQDEFNTRRALKRKRAGKDIDEFGADEHSMDHLVNH